MSRGLSARSEAVLRLIVQGHSYSEIVDRVPDCTYADIFAAAAEALEASGEKPSNKGWLARFRDRFPRARVSSASCEAATRFGREVTVIRAHKRGLSAEQTN